MPFIKKIMNEISSDIEKLRLNALKELQILNTLPEQEFDDITLLASQICETPMAAISLIDEDRQWFKSRIGLEVGETPRDCAFCDYAIRSENLFTVADASQDFRFSSNPLVTDDPHVRFYAGAPLTTSDGYKIGTLCVIDRKPRELSEAQQRALSALGRSVMNSIEARSLKEKSVSPDENSIDISTEPEKNDLKNNSFFNRYVKNYLIAALIIIVITLIKLLLSSFLQIESPFLLFAFAILLSAWRGGFGVGLSATFATMLIINYFFIPPYGSLLNHDFKQNSVFLIFVAQGIFISALCASRLRSEKLLYQSGKNLENRVAQRTAQLAEANQELKQEIYERNILQKDLKSAHDSALESARLKSEFLANMSHEIRTPMNGVIGMTGLLLETKLDDEQHRFAGIIRSSGESLLTIINDILDFSKVEAGKLELEMLEFNLRETVESLIELFSNRAREQQNELTALIYSDVPLFLRGDAGRVRQILTNLIGNAIKFTKDGDILIRVENIRENPTRVLLKISVTDTGEGISDEVKGKLFQPFTQSDASTTRRYGGTGLGLSISKKLVEMMDGEIGLESVIGEGSTFWFNVSLEKQTIISPSLAENLSPYDYRELEGKRVLIVDDNQVNREVLTYQTRAWGMETLEVFDGIKAVELVETSAKSFDLVILDSEMPIVDGLETARQIVSKNINPLPAIIMISSSGVKMDERKMLEAGIKASLTKPYRQDDLLEIICKTLKISRNESFEDSDIHITATMAAPDFVQGKDKSRRILIVEDNTVNQMVAQNLLKNFGYHADVAANGREALQALEIIPYDLILMDCQMPEMDGYEATREIRSRDWQAAQIPIIALTAHATGGEREKCLAAGMDDFISKPIQKENLFQKLAVWLAQSESEKSSMILTKLNEDKPESAEQLPVPPVDFAVLNDITDNDDDIKREVIEIYLAQTADSLSAIEQAIKVGDAQKLYELAHKTVGGSALCGMTAIVAPMRKLEQMGRDGRTAEALPFFTQAQNAFAEIDRECREKVLFEQNTLCEKL